MKILERKVSVIAPARLHMGFLDLSGSLGRNFGSIGIALNEIATRLSMTYSDRLVINGPSSDRAEKCIKFLCEEQNISSQLEINIESAIPEHVGLGSGTQMSLAIGSALNAFYDLDLTVREIAQLMDRGMRSGIGIGVFEQGGLVVDGGRGAQTITPPVICHMDIPDDWRFILIFDKRGKGLHGVQELLAFKELPPFSRQEAERLSYLLLMQGLPAIAERNIKLFGDVITQLQQSVGKHFATAQGGIFTSNEVSTVMRWLKQQGVVAIGQTSWGPTGFCAVESKSIADSLVTNLSDIFSDLTNISFASVSARKSGGDVFIH